MSYPWVNGDWTDPINQSLYASFLFWVLQNLGMLIWSALKRWTNLNKVVSALGWLVLALPPLAIVGASLRQGVVTPWMILLFSLTLLPAIIKSVQTFMALKALHRAGVHGAIQDPGVADYREFLIQAHSKFAFLGVGAEKLTRDFDVFQAMVARCGTSSKPVRLLLVSPTASWLHTGASRRGLNKAAFQIKQEDSLRKIARVKSEFSGELEVRFYQDRPGLRLMFANGDVCWLGHYTETAASQGKNEYEQRSNSCVVLRRLGDRAPDQQLYGALEGLFDEMWESTRGQQWDFKTYLP